MADTTPIFGFPFPEDTDPTDVAGDIQALAEAVEVDLNAVENRVDDVEKAITLHTFTANGSLAAATVTGAKKLRVRCIGGGGAGGGAPATGVSESSGGAGGQGGHYAESVLTVSALTFPLQVNVGAAGVAASGAAGGNGGTSGVVNNNGAGAVQVSAGGGAGGGVMATGGTVGTYASPGNAATVATGTIQAKGVPGGRAYRVAATTVFAGYGGASILGGGAPESTAANNQGGAGGSYGAGGAGSSRAASSAALLGGAGAAGIVIIEAIY